MITILSRIFIRNYKSYSDAKVRKAYGMLCGTVGILLNLILFAGKFFAGILSGSVAITADAFNNLSDSFSSAITLFGFKLAGQKPDSEHPFGHGRFEYIAGLIVALAIILMGVELIQSSVTKIFHPEKLSFSPVIVLILVLSILVKLYMAVYNRVIGVRIESSTIRAVSADSMSDTVSTLVVLLSTLVSHYTSLEIDGYCGALVGIFVCYTGYRSLKDTVSPLLGQAPDPEFVENVKKIVLSSENISGIHDLIVHNYGAEHILLSLHAEVPADGGLVELHDEIDSIEHTLKEKLHCTAVIHMDPVFPENDISRDLKERILLYLHGLDKRFSIHDFRMIKEGSNTKICFDISAPFDYPLSDEELSAVVKCKLSEENPAYVGVIDVDRQEG